MNIHERAEQLSKQCTVIVHTGTKEKHIAAIESALRDVVEVCAKVSESHIPNVINLYQGKLPFVFYKPHDKPETDIQASVAVYTGEQIAAAIRGLKETP